MQKTWETQKQSACLRHRSDSEKIITEKQLEENSKENKTSVVKNYCDNDVLQTKDLTSFDCRNIWKSF